MYIRLSANVYTTMRTITGFSSWLNKEHLYPRLSANQSF